MQYVMPSRLLPISLLVIGGCATSGQPVRSPAPLQCRLSPVDSALMEKTDYVRQASEEFFESSGSAKLSATPSSKP
ncbi:hypothetical protein SAMN02800692_1528 [Luteibacter sp. UNC138MFCol5.1]|uniref:hypothetical protein n=1 Tax=Luteibacter sp. UNC138MFCol5.1 TaxID=1502774 RepID=UPI0008D38731|nr:hypothetical protein [Luteibacter sp. UNC138MFCol5.1]SEO63614.1 hypothetical protein SAMN02800692_1528 [Luteibacter sp. UNC138MFCol5.1]